MKLFLHGLVVAAALLCAPPAPAQSPTPAVADSAAATQAPAPSLPDSITVPAPVAAAAHAPLGGSRKVRLHKTAHNVARSGPGDRFAVVGVHPKDASFPVITKTGDWINVRLSVSETGWFHASLCEEFDDISDLEFRPNPKLYSRTGSFVLGGYGGGYAFDRKSNSLVLGARLGYYVFDRIQAEGGVAWTHVHRPAEIVESLFDLSLEAEDFDLLAYHMNLTWEILPGRQMVPFIAGGVGSAIMLGRTEPSFNIGAGTMLFLSKRTAMRWEVRDFVFDSGADDARRTNHNIEFTLGTAFLF